MVGEFTCQPKWDPFGFDNHSQIRSQVKGLLCTNAHISPEKRVGQERSDPRSQVSCLHKVGTHWAGSVFFLLLFPRSRWTSSRASRRSTGGSGNVGSPGAPTMPTGCMVLRVPSISILSRDLDLSRKPPLKPRESGWFLRQTMVGKNGESSPGLV